MNAGELTGSFLDHQNGLSLPYVVAYKSVGDEVHWAARIRLASVWHAVDASPAGRSFQPFGKLETEEDVRDAALSAMCALDMPAALRAAMAARRIRRTRQLVCTGLMAAVMGSGAWLWHTGAFVG